MPRHPILALVAVLGLAVVLGGSRPLVAAQEATPEAVEPIVTGEVVFHEFADFGVVGAETLPAAPVTVALFRLELAPGASIAYPPGDPGMGGHLVESGTLTLRNFSEDIVIARASNEATPDAETSEILPAGSETVLEQGDGFLFPPIAAGEFHNDGAEPVVLAIALLFPQAATTAPTPGA